MHSMSDVYVGRTFVPCRGDHDDCCFSEDTFASDGLCPYETKRTRLLDSSAKVLGRWMNATRRNVRRITQQLSIKLVGVLYAVNPETASVTLEQFHGLKIRGLPGISRRRGSGLRGGGDLFAEHPKSSPSRPFVSGSFPRRIGSQEGSPRGVE